MSGLTQHSDCLQPAEYFLDPFPLDLTDFVSGVSRGAPINGAARTVKKLERAEENEHMMVRFDEEEPSGAPVSVRDRDGQSAASAAE